MIEEITLGPSGTDGNSAAHELGSRLDAPAGRTVPAADRKPAEYDAGRASQVRMRDFYFSVELI